jgi:hypothetical protein
VRGRKLRRPIAGLAAIVAVGAVFLLTRPSRITRENFDRIHTGMRREEVRAILGPPGDYSTGPGEYKGWSPVAGVRWDDNPAADDVWLSDDMDIEVSYSNTGSVKRAACEPVIRHERGPLDNFLWRVERLWRQWLPGR